MIGGLVIETVILPDKVWVNTAERQSTSKCAIYVERSVFAEQIRIGDIIWWQGGFAMWTPVSKKFVEKKLKRIGFSGVNRPI